MDSGGCVDLARCAASPATPREAAGRANAPGRSPGMARRGPSTHVQTTSHTAHRGAAPLSHGPITAAPTSASPALPAATPAQRRSRPPRAGPKYAQPTNAGTSGDRAAAAYAPTKGPKYQKARRADARGWVNACAALHASVRASAAAQLASAQPSARYHQPAGGPRRRLASMGLGRSV
jgi:hypothetical protein